MRCAAAALQKLARDPRYLGGGWASWRYCTPRPGTCVITRTFICSLPGTIKFKMWGSTATGDHPRTLDTVDTYTNTSNLRPLIGGWEPIADYFERVKAGFSAFSAKAPSVDALRKACEIVPVPRLSR